MSRVRAGRSCCCTAAADPARSPVSAPCWPAPGPPGRSARPTPASAAPPAPRRCTPWPGSPGSTWRCLDQLGLDDVTVVGNSIGGWIAAEMALLASPRVSGIILVNGVGIQVPDHPIADFFSLTMDQVTQLSYHDPDRFRIDPATLPPAAQAGMAGNRATLAVYAGTAMSDPTLAGRLSVVETPTWVLWGDSDQIVDPDYGRAFAAAIPSARFQLLTDTGHMPQLETPDQLLQAIWAS